MPQADAALRLLFGEKLVALVDASAGRGLDRIVPLGPALRFSHRWDGMDLLEELTRGVVLDAMG